MPVTRGAFIEVVQELIIDLAEELKEV